MIGKAISHYRILEKLGEGGMGVVYKARDTHLDRFVAIKVLPADKVADPERKQRFVKEAKLASSLNHPNIITIYDIGQAEGVDFIAMECVTGKTLDQVIPRHGMRLNEALKCAVQIADALARAHSAGITHRDLKPGNIMLNEHGLVKVLDFGLAKLIEAPLPDDDSTRTMRPTTEEGTIVGTIAYMSPEQAEDKKVDARSDIFSFGSVLYEMVTGEQAFHGDTKASTLAAILKDNPRPASQLADGLPREVERLISRCMRKEVNQRSQHMDDVKIALQELKEESDSGVLGAAAVSRPNPHRRLHWVLSVAAAVVVAMVGVWLVRSKTQMPEVSLFAVPLTSYPGNESSPSFSPDGTQVAFAWDGEKQNNWDIYVKQIGVEPPYRLTNDPAGDYSPAWSPDGRFIAFLREVSTGKTAIMLTPQRGGSERILAEIDGAVRRLGYGPFLSWTPDSKWLVAPTPTTGQQRGWALRLFSTETGEQNPLTTPPSEEIGDTAPAVSPDGRTLVFSRVSPDYYNVTLWLLRLGEGYKPLDREEKVQTGQMTNTSAAWLPDGREFVFSFGAGTGIGLSRIAASNGAQPRRISLDASGATEPAISRVGNRLAFSSVKFDPNIWRIDLKGPGQKPGLPSRFIASTQQELYPAYSPDNRRIAFMSQRSGTDEIWICDSDGSKAAQLTSLGGAAIYGPNWSPDSRTIAFTAAQKGMKEDIYSISANGGTPRRLTSHPAEDKWPYWSHDGKWIYFSSTRSGREEIWKMSSSGGEAVQITRNSGDTPQESPDGKFLYFIKGWPEAVSVWRTSVDGNQEEKVLDSIHSEGQFSVWKEGIYFFKPEKIGHSDISFYEFATGQIRKVLTIERPVNNHIAVSPDGRTILYPQSDESGSVLVLVENFR